MDNIDITFEKRIITLAWAFILVASFLLFNLATIMSVIPISSDSYTAYAPNQIHIDPFIPEWSCRDFEVGDTLDQFNYCFDYFFEEGELSPAYPQKKMYQPYTIEKLPDSIAKGYF